MNRPWIALAGALALAASTAAGAWEFELRKPFDARAMICRTAAAAEEVVAAEKKDGIAAAVAAYEASPDCLITYARISVQRVLKSVVMSPERTVRVLELRVYFEGEGESTFYTITDGTPKGERSL